MPDYSRFLNRMRAADAARGRDEHRSLEKLRRAKQPRHRAERIDISKIAEQFGPAETVKPRPALNRSKLH